MKNLIITILLFSAFSDMFSQGGVNVRYIPVDSASETLLHKKVKIDFISAVGPKLSTIDRARIADTVIIEIDSRRIKVIEIKGVGSDYWDFNRERLQLVDYESGLTAVSGEIEVLDIRKDSIFFRIEIEVYRKIKAKLTYLHHRVTDVWIPKSKIEGIMLEKSTRSDMANLIGKLVQSSNSKFIFNLREIPMTITDAILRIRDSIENVTKLPPTKSSLKTFMADTYGEWNSTDNLINENWPSRRFIYAINAGEKWVITYEHGGVGNHFHIVYTDILTPNVLTAGTTLLNMEKIGHLIFEGKQDGISNLKLTLIIQPDEFDIFEGKVVRDIDML